MAVREFLRKQMQAMIFGRTGGNRWPFAALLPRTRIDYASEMGDGTRSDIVMGNVHWLMTNIQEPPIAMSRRAQDGDEQPVERHPLLDLLESPNPAYDGAILLAATELSYIVDGNAYWLLVRSGAGRVVEIWWVPHWMIEPRWPRDGSEFISHYRYTPGSVPINLDPEDVVHFRFGLDPDNQRKGLSRLKTVMRELFTDSEAANWTAALLKNGAAPGVVISPEPGDSEVHPDDLQATKSYVQDRFTGDNRGAPLVLGGATRIAEFGFNPRQMNLKDIRRVPEERGCAAIGVPPIIAGFGAGLEHATYSNYEIAQRVVYRSNLVPTWRSWGRTIRRQLLTHFESDIAPYQVYFDTSEIEALQEDESARVERLLKELAGSGIMLSEYREARGWEVKDNQRVFLRALNIIEVPEDLVGQIPEPEPLPPPVEEPEEEEPTEEPEEE